MENQVMQIAQRLKGTRILEGYTPEEMAAATDVTLEEYLRYESGEVDFGFTFIYKCANKLGLDISELIIGEMPKLSFYTIVRKNEGMDIKRREGFKYLHKAAYIKNRSAEPFVVTAPYREEEQNAPIPLSSHKGHEFDMVLSGKLKITLGTHTEILEAGDSVYYDSGHPHGMIAVGGEPCEFLAVVLDDSDDK